MADYKFQVPRLRDADLLSFLKSASEMVDATSCNISEIGSARGEQFPINDEKWRTHPLASSDRYTIYSATIGAANFNLVIERNIASNADFAFDVLSITNNPKDGVPPEKVSRLNQLISDSFLANTDQNAKLFHNSQSFTLLMKSHQKMIEQLQRTVANVGEQAAAVRLRLEEEYNERNAQLDAQFATRQTEAEKTIEEAKRALQRTEEELAARQKDLDDRSNTHARRELHQELKSKIVARSNKFQITPETKSNRTPIHLGVIGSSAVLVGFLAYYANALSSLPAGATTAQIIISGLKPVGLTVALLGLIAWYLRWMNRWFERYADAEFQLKQFDLDIDRASWVVEAALEWRLSQEKPMPEHLLETISRNLFARGEKDESADMHPADYLASAILGRASGVNLKMPGAEISLTGKDLKKLQTDEG
ncbi:hypothetical protein [Mesorhizobium sp.]|uniref:hypothetical protein n=1 Tax=Mesorhizobium sp. TaxID=1871066 RepID=UPI000FE6AF09|nr:hypothetical protein [Mesorhizobium sp.]RWB43227.1 MAG: hypothetical protein EOQ42_29800 [Mesorhizobium sp.]RWE91629.1 MAG: hypothetical protein EOS43_32300 [Mesorhizobium sp.]